MCRFDSQSVAHQPVNLTIFRPGVNFARLLVVNPLGSPTKKREKLTSRPALFLTNLILNVAEDFCEIFNSERLVLNSTVTTILKTSVKLTATITNQVILIFRVSYDFVQIIADVCDQKPLNISFVYLFHTHLVIKKFILT